MDTAAQDIDFSLSSCGTQALERAGLVAPWHVGSQFPDQGWNPRPLHWKADSLPLDHQGSPASSCILTASYSMGNLLIKILFVYTEMTYTF